MTDPNAVGLVVGVLMVLWGIKDSVTIRIGRVVVKMSLGGFLIAVSLGIIIL